MNQKMKNGPKRTKTMASQFSRNRTLELLLFFPEAG
jgi:hypothetical protein